MHKETVTYTDFDGVERTEDVYFNLSEAEILEMQLSVAGGYDKRLERIVAAKSQPEIIAEFKDMLLKAYGQKSEDGRRFIKTPALTEEFMQTPIYSQLYMKYALDDEAGAAFMNGIMPKDMIDRMAEAAKAKQAAAALPASN